MVSIPLPNDSKRIEYHDGIPVYVGYSDAEYRQLLAEEYHTRPLGVICDICHYNEATSLWKHARPYCESCMERERRADAEKARTESKVIDITTRKPATKTGKRIVYASVPMGHAVTDDGQPIDFPAHCSLYELVSHLPEDIDRISLCLPLPEEYASWLIDHEMYKDYRTGKGGHYLSDKVESEHVGRYQDRVTGRLLEIRTNATWFGDEEVTPEEARDSMELLRRYLKAIFQVNGKPYERIQIYATPAQTFGHLWKEGNAIRNGLKKERMKRLGKEFRPEDEVKFPPLPEELRTLIHGSNGQGRIQMLTLPTLKKISSLFYYDGIFKYAAHAWGMPTGVKCHDHENEYAGKVPARYRIRYTVPLSWQHIGIFQTPREQVTGDQKDNTSWAYPGMEEAGRTFETWADGSELDVCIWFHAGMNQLKDTAYAEATKEAFRIWNITILERIVFEVATDKKPLDDITSKIIKMRESIEQEATDDRLSKLVRGMARNIELHGIGGFHRSVFNTTFIGRNDEAPEEFLSSPIDIGNGLLSYTVPGKLSKFLEQFEHPEWSQLIWARTRASMTKAALTLPRESLIAIRTDAIATTQRVPEWDTNTKVGTLRPKQQIIKKLDAPHKDEAFDEIIRKWGK